MIATQKHQQLILLEPKSAELLSSLAKELKTTKQSLLRDAVDNLLAMHGLGFSKTVHDMRETVKDCRSQVMKVRRKYAADPVVNRACGETALHLAALLMELGERKVPK